MPFVVQELKIKFLCGGIFTFGQSPIQTLIPVLLRFWGPIGAFWVSGNQNQVLLFLWGVSQTQILPPTFAYNWAQ
jgi:hypothetical protein